MKLFFVCLLSLLTVLNVSAQVPYDYIPLGRQSRRDVARPHPSDVNLNYERLFPARRKWLD